MVPPPLVGAVVERTPSSIATPPRQPSGNAHAKGFPAVQHRSKSAFSKARSKLRDERARDVPIVQGSKGAVNLAEGKEDKDVKTALREDVARKQSGQGVQCYIKLFRAFTCLMPCSLCSVSKEVSVSIASSAQNIDSVDQSATNDDLSNTERDEWREQMSQDNDRMIEAMTEEERQRHRTEILEQLGPDVGRLLQEVRMARELSKNLQLGSSTLSEVSALFPLNTAQDLKADNRPRKVR